MKLYGLRGEEIVVTWGDHSFGCKACREVVMEKPATFGAVCAQGAQLLNDELAKRQAPVEREKAKAVEQWAKERGTFIKSKVTRVPMKYVGDDAA